MTLATFLRFSWQQILRRGEVRRSFPALKSYAAIAPALRLLPPETITRVVEMDLEGSDAGWRSAGLTLERGQGFTVFADGVVWLSPALSIGASAVSAVWVRIGGRAPVRKLTDNATSFEAWGDGELELCLKPPGEWLDESGAFDPAVPRAGASGKVAVTIASWPGAAAPGMEAFARVTGLKDVVPAASPPPQGWNYLWRLGEGTIYRDSAHDGQRCIHVHTNGDVGILQYLIDLPLSDDLALEWRWRVDRLPSDLPENIQPTHDYLSIAVEYDNGQDLTYYWSSSLPAGTIFKCPLAWWDKRETHWAVRSGEAELGTWVAESRPLKVDYGKAIGGELPRRIVRVWLIANSLFQRRVGEARFADIALVSGGRRRQIV